MYTFRCGLKFSPQPPRLRFSTYLMAAALPAVPDSFGHQSLIPVDGWGMLLNDSVGDCTIAGAMHTSMLWNRIAGRQVHFTNTDAIEDYSAVSGYVSGDESTDQGADMVAVAAYWKNTGMRDDTGARHQIGAYLSIDPKNIDHICAASYLFGAVGLGINLPSSAERQFMNGLPWDVVPGDSNEGGHFIPLVSRGPAGYGVVTWGKLQTMTPAFASAYIEEAIAYLSPEMLVNGKSAEGFDMAALQYDLEVVA